MMWVISVYVCVYVCTKVYGFILCKCLYFCILIVFCGVLYTCLCCVCLYVMLCLCVYVCMKIITLTKITLTVIGYMETAINTEGY